MCVPAMCRCCCRCVNRGAFPALVRQGQISELINAKPKNRRRILEEAAGISGLYQRRHEAELKLKSAEANLLRVDDVIEQLSNQLAQLMRQAKQAARIVKLVKACATQKVCCCSNVGKRRIMHAYPQNNS